MLVLRRLKGLLRRWVRRALFLPPEGPKTIKSTWLRCGFLGLLFDFGV
jgi:hypothetical protein